MPAGPSSAEHNRFKELRRRRVPKFNAAVAAGSPTRFWRMPGHPAVQQASAITFATHSVYPDSTSLPTLNPVEPPCTEPYAVVWGRLAPRGVPYPDQCRAAFDRNWGAIISELMGGLPGNQQRFPISKRFPISQYQSKSDFL